MQIARRHFLGATAWLATSASHALSQDETPPAADRAAEPERPLWLRNAMTFGDRFVEWQTPYGGPDPVKCPYRTPGKVTPVVIQGVGPQVRALYQLYDATHLEKYKMAADRHAVFLLNTLHDPPTPYSNRIPLDGEDRYALSTSWMYGKALSPCYEWFVRHNPQEPAFELKAHAIYRWLQRHRRDDSYFGTGYPSGPHPDAQFSCDLGEVGTGLVGFFNVSQHRPALEDALGLANYFLTDYVAGSARGVWSPQLGTWLVGPWSEGGAEHFTVQRYNETGWGWSCLVVGEFLLALRRHTQDAALRSRIDDHCVRALCWCLDHCQFDDGAHGMFGRDDKWVGQTAAAIQLYGLLGEQQVMAADLEQTYRPKIEKSWRWLLGNTSPETYPRDGYVRVSGTTTKDPPENLMWLMAWTLEALLAGGKMFEVQS